MTFFGKFGFGECFGTSLSSYWASCRQLSYKIYFLSPVTIWSRMVRCCIEWEKMTQYNDFFFLFLVSSQGTHLLSFFTFPICFKCWTTIGWLMSSSLATSHVFIRRSASVTFLNWSLSNFDVWPLRYSSSNLSSPLQNFLNQLYTLHSLAVPGLKCWCCKLSPQLYNPFSAWIRKLL